jgi:hypothetical protein
MFESTLLGSYAGILYPSLVALFKGSLGHLTTLFSELAKNLFPTAGVTAAGFNVVGFAVALIVVLLIAAIIAAVVSAIAFFGYLSDDAKRAQLIALGRLAYFSAISVGFAAGLGFENAATG